MNSAQIDPKYVYYALQLAKFAGIIIIGLMGVYFIRKWLKHQLIKTYPDALRINLIVRLMTYALLFLIATIALQEVGINMTALIGAAGVFGVAIGFASQTSFSNIISGIFLTLEHPFELDDTVLINGQKGKIKAVNLFAITIEKFDGHIARIPNEQVLKGNIINITKNPLRRFETIIELASTTDINQAKTIIKSVAQEAEYALQKPAPFIGVQKISGDGTELFVGVWTKHADWNRIQSAFLEQVKQAFDQQEIKLARITIVAQT